MANRKLGIAQQAVEDVRSRLFTKSWDTMIFDVRLRIFRLGALIGTAAGDELHRHVIVGAIAALETFHRGTIVSIVDSGDEYKVRAAENIGEKISLKDALAWLTGKTVTFGELIAHTASCNSVTDLLSWLEVLLACDVKHAFAEVINPYDRRNKTVAPKRVVSDVDRLLTDLGEAFRFRHILAHEAAPRFTVESSECGRLLAAVQLWVDAVDAVLWSTVYKDLPLTQWEMNQLAWSEVSSARKQLALAMRRAMSDARRARSASWLRSNHFTWMKATEDWSRETYGSLQGTMWPAVRGQDLAEAIRFRAEQVGRWVGARNPEHGELQPASPLSDLSKSRKS